ncbi:hypothetical protein FHW36_10436 [Chitinophaga polysaccharea]|uniref:Uncharacterized protein n=1 Tax=Chitinophaga polysaccharea TaxID=1293035 RepID=A0A561PQF1_9BACT|nr:hypothetical protein FHW36_10436 [Chitinophaga polysaccharea]
MLNMTEGALLAVFEDIVPNDCCSSECLTWQLQVLHSFKFSIAYIDVVRGKAERYFYVIQPWIMVSKKQQGPSLQWLL